MKFGWLANTWSSKNVVCRENNICYWNTEYTCRICMFCLNSFKSTSICSVHIPINIPGWTDGLQWIWWIRWIGWKSYGNHMTTMWGTCANCVQSMCKPCVHENHMRTVSWWSQIRNPKIKPGLPNEYQDMVIKECQLQGGHYLLQKCILHLHNLHVFHPIHPINPSHPSHMETT